MPNELHAPEGRGGFGLSPWLLILPACLAIPLLFWGLGSSPVVDGDESVYVLVARDILRTGDWLSPTLDGEAFLAKPPVFLWMIAASLDLVSSTDFGSRLPFALCGVGVILLTSLLCHGLTKSVVAGLVAGFVMALNPQFLFLHCARRAEPDVVFLLFFLGSVFCLTWALGGKKRALPFAFFLAGLAGMAKTLAVVMFPLAVLLILLVLTRSLRRFSLRDYSFSLLALLVALTPWHLFAVVAHGSGFLSNYLLQQTLDRFSAPDITWSAQVQRYSLAAVAGFHPFLLLILAGIPRAVFSKDPRIKVASRTALLWIGVVALIVLPVLPGRNWYTLPAYPALALLSGVAVVSYRRTVLSILLVASVFLGLAIRVSGAFDPFSALSELAALRMRLEVVEGWGGWAVGFGAVVVCVAALCHFRRNLATSVGAFFVWGSFILLSILSLLGITRVLSRVEVRAPVNEFLSTLNLGNVPRAYAGRVMPRLDHRIYLDPFPETAMEIFCDDPSSAAGFLRRHPEVLFVPAADLPKIQKELDQELALIGFDRLLLGYHPDEPQLFLAVGSRGKERPSVAELQSRLETELDLPSLSFVALDLSLAGGKESSSLILKRARTLVESTRGQRDGREQVRRATRTLLAAVSMLEDSSVLPEVRKWLSERELGPWLRNDLLVLACSLGDQETQESLLASLRDGREKGFPSLDVARALCIHRFSEFATIVGSRSHSPKKAATFLTVAAGKKIVQERARDLLEQESPACHLLAVALLAKPDGREVVLSAKDREDRRAILHHIAEASPFSEVQVAALEAANSFHPGIWKTW